MQVSREFLQRSSNFEFRISVCFKKIKAMEDIQMLKLCPIIRLFVGDTDDADCLRHMPKSEAIYGFDSLHLLFFLQDFLVMERSSRDSQDPIETSTAYKLLLTRIKSNNHMMDHSWTLFTRQLANW